MFEIKLSAFHSWLCRFPNLYLRASHLNFCCPALHICELRLIVGVSISQVIVWIRGHLVSKGHSAVPAHSKHFISIGFSILGGRMVL